MKTRLLKKLRKEAKKKIYIESRCAGIRKPPYYFVGDIYFHRNTQITCDTHITLEEAIDVARGWRRDYILSEIHKMLHERQILRDNKRLDL